MSVKASHWAWQQVLPPPQKVVLLAMADHADDQGRCWPSIGLLAKKSCSSPRTIQRVIRDLQAAGLVHVTTRPRTGGKGNFSNLYTLTVSLPPAN